MKIKKLWKSGLWAVALATSVEMEVLTTSRGADCNTILLQQTQCSGLVNGSVLGISYSLFVMHPLAHGAGVTSGISRSDLSCAESRGSAGVKFQ